MTEIDDFIKRLEKKVGGIFIGVINGHNIDREKAKKWVKKEVIALCENYDKNEYSFDLNEKERKKLEKWQKKIKKKHGQYGSFTFKFTPTGIGNGITVYSHLENEELDVTDIDSW